MGASHLVQSWQLDLLHPRSPGWPQPACTAPVPVRACHWPAGPQLGNQSRHKILMFQREGQLSSLSLPKMLVRKGQCSSGVKAAEQAALSPSLAFHSILHTQLLIPGLSLIYQDHFEILSHL